MNQFNSFSKHCLALILLVAIGCMFACNNAGDKAKGDGEKAGEDTETAAAPTKDNNAAVLHVLADPDQLNPLNYNSATSGYVLGRVFQTLMNVDFNKLELVPTLVVARPEIKATPEGKMTISYEIRPEAAWDNGEPITAKDVEFSVKLLKHTKIDCDRIRPYYEFIEEVIVDESNPKKFTFLCKEPYMIAESSSADITVMPAYVYDPKGVMAKYSLKEWTEKGDKISEEPEMIAFAQEFNSEKFQREQVVGSGAYKVKKWETNQRVVLERKKDWWGDKAANKTEHLVAHPEELTYETINDLATAVVALKGQKLDAMNSIPPKDFVKDLPKSDKFSNNFNTFTPPQLSYDYIAFNLKNPLFKDVRTRKAIAHLMNIEKLIKTTSYGLGQRTTGFLHPDNKFYNKSLTPYPFNIEDAKKLLAEAGWKDSNGNGTLDMTIDGKPTEFEAEISYNSGNDRRKNACLLLQEAARKVGIKIDIVVKEASVFFDDLRKHKFEMGVGGWIASPVESDPKQIWHSESANGGSNFTYFGTPETDKLIEDLRKELDESKRKDYYLKIQEIIHNEVPYVFLLVQKERIAINKAFADPTVSAMRPGYLSPSFKLAAK